MTTGSSDSGGPDRLTRETAQDLVDEIIEKYGREISARQVLAEHEELKQFRSCVVDLAYEEYANAKEQGREIAATEFVQQFKGVEQSLYRMLEFDQVLRENPSLVEPVPEDRWPRKGQEYHNFLLLSDVGRGALSRVFLARHTQLGEKPVIVKVCVRGQREAGLLGSLAHPSIGEVHSLHEDQSSGLAVICMPYQTRSTIHEVAEWLVNEREAGRSTFLASEISEHIQEESRIQLEGVDPEPFAGLAAGYFEDDPLDQLVAKWGIHLCSALGHAHQKGVLHCDVKPGNILLLPDLSIRLLDFNLATRQEDKARMAGGTPPFMAPEQLELMLQMSRASASATAPEATVEIDEQSDVFGLCATLWHLVTGAPPFGSTVESRTPEQAAETMLARQAVGVGSNVVAAARRTVPSALVDVLLRGLSLDRSERHASVEELREELQGCVRRRRRRLSWVLASIVAVASAVLGVSAFVYVDPAQTALSDARTAFQAGDFDTAAAELQLYRTATPQLQVWELASRTCGEKLIVRNAGKSKQEAPFLQRWAQLEQDWGELAAETPYAVECWYNQYLVISEITSSRSTMDGAADALSRAFDAGLDRERFHADLRALEIYRASEKDEISMETLKAAIDESQELSRGQMFFLIAGLRNLFLLDKDDTEYMEAVAVQTRRLLPWFGAEGSPIEAMAIQRLAFTDRSHPEFLKHSQRARSTREKREGLEEAPNRLGDALMLPDREIAQVLVTGRSVGLTAGHDAGLLKTARRQKTTRPGIKR